MRSSECCAGVSRRWCASSHTHKMQTCRMQSADRSHDFVAIFFQAVTVVVKTRTNLPRREREKAGRTRAAYVSVCYKDFVVGIVSNQITWGLYGEIYGERYEKRLSSELLRTKRQNCRAGRECERSRRTADSPESRHPHFELEYMLFFHAIEVLENIPHRALLNALFKLKK